MPVDRRSMLSGAFALMSAPAAAQGYAGTAARPDQRPFPPPDTRSVWLVGDDGVRPPAQAAARLAELAGPGVRDGYLDGGAVAELESAFASLLGKEACAFMPTGTLANTVALRVLCGEHHHALCQHDSHLYRDESDGVQRLSGINLVPLAAGRAAPDLDELRVAFDEAENGPYPLKVGALALESPVRRLDGAMVPPSDLPAIASLAGKHQVPMHLDGARLLLAPPSVDVKAYAAPFTTVYVSLYKYLGAPFGAVLAGPGSVIAQAREYRHLYGGLLYQGWMPAVLALDELRDVRSVMARAHAAAETLMRLLERSGAARRRPQVAPSNIFLLEMPKARAEAAFERGRQAGVRIGGWTEGAVPLYVNRTILRRDVGDYATLFTG